MLKSLLIRAGLLAFIVSSVACSGGSMPTAPLPMALNVTPAPGTGPGPSSEASGSRIFDFLSAPATVSTGTAGSRFILYGDGTFFLQFPNGKYGGTYMEVAGNVTFRWQGFSTAGPWGATGVLSGNSLAVTYNTIMMLSDFEDALYKLK